MFQTIKETRTYLGCTIERLRPSGMYYALTSQGSVRADTIAGIKSLIKERERPVKKKR